MAAPPHIKRRALTALQVAAVLAAGVATVAIVDDWSIGTAAQPAAPALAADVADAADPDVLAATINISLVHAGTDRPFSGNGIPGILLRATTPGDVLGWTLNAWANESVPSTPSLCHEPGLFFDRNDWLYEADGGTPQGRGTYTTTPTTVPARLGPDGDQCFIRTGATGVWVVQACIEGEPQAPSDERGPPRGYWKDAGGQLHVDAWDRCWEQTFRVPA